MPLFAIGCGSRGGLSQAHLLEHLSWREILASSQGLRWSQGTLLLEVDLRYSALLARENKLYVLIVDILEPLVDFDDGGFIDLLLLLVAKEILSESEL